MPKGKKKTKNYDQLISDSLTKIEKLKAQLHNEEMNYDQLRNEKHEVEVNNFVDYMNKHKLDLDYVKNLVEKDKSPMEVNLINLPTVE